MTQTHPCCELPEDKGLLTWSYTHTWRAGQRVKKQRAFPTRGLRQMPSWMCHLERGIGGRKGQCGLPTWLGLNAERSGWNLGVMWRGSGGRLGNLEVVQACTSSRVAPAQFSFHPPFSLPLPVKCPRLEPLPAFLAPKALLASVLSSVTCCP